MKFKYLISIIIYLLLTNDLIAQTAKEVARIGIQSTVSVVSLDNIRQPLGYGSGFILENGLVVTNLHVIEGSHSAYILNSENRDKFNVTGFVAVDKVNDLIILKVDGIKGTPLSLGDDILPEIGERVYAIGNPKGLSGTFSEGIVSGIRDVKENEVIQITAPISPGSSGGPVLNSNSEVVGIAFASYSAGQNLNFAIPVKHLKRLKPSLGSLQNLSILKPSTRTTTVNVIAPNIKEGVILRNIEPCYKCRPTMVFFSVKNNLPYIVSNIKILFLAYDLSGTVIDYNEYTYFPYGIKPYLAKTIDSGGEAPQISLKSGYKVKARVLDFNIIEE